FLARQARPAEVGVGTMPDLGQRLRERDQASVLHLVAHFAPQPVVAVLLASARVAAGRLQMTARVWTDPDVLPRRRNHQRADALQLRRSANEAAVGGDIAHARLRADALDAWRAAIVHVTESGDLRGLRRRQRRLRACQRPSARARRRGSGLLTMERAP